MTRALLRHNAPTVSLSLTVNVNINADKFLLLLVGLVWLTTQQVRKAAAVGGLVVQSYIDDAVTAYKIGAILFKSAAWG